MNEFREMTVEELDRELEQLYRERRELTVADPDGDWDQVVREIDQIERLLKTKKSV
mgnify:CR=1 FL=1